MNTWTGLLLTSPRFSRGLVGHCGLDRAVEAGAAHHTGALPTRWSRASPTGPDRAPSPRHDASLRSSLAGPARLVAPPSSRASGEPMRSTDCLDVAKTSSENRPGKER